jgi:hypothetical protein
MKDDAIHIFFDVFEIPAVKLMDNQWVRSMIVKDSY